MQEGDESEVDSKFEDDGDQKSDEGEESDGKKEEEND